MVLHALWGVYGRRKSFTSFKPLVGGVHSIKRSGGCRLRLEQHRGGSSALDCVEEVDESSRIGLFVRASVQV